jgi:pilus assembly protein CpaC
MRSMRILARTALVALELTGIWLVVGTVARAAMPSAETLVATASMPVARESGGGGVLTPDAASPVRAPHGGKAMHHRAPKVASHHPHQGTVAGAVRRAGHRSLPVLAAAESVGPLVSSQPAAPPPAPAATVEPQSPVVADAAAPAAPPPAAAPAATAEAKKPAVGNVAVPADVRRLAAQASGWPTAKASAAPITLESGTGRVLTLTSDAANVFVADPKVAEVRPASANSLFVFGVGAGRTTVAAMDATGQVLAQFNVTVRQSGFAAAEAEAEIARLMPEDHIGVVPQAKGLLLTGYVPSAGEAARASSIAHGFLGDGQVVENQISVGAQVQITLRVRIAEMSRTVVRNLGIDWSALGTRGSIGTFPALNIARTSAAGAAASGVCTIGSGLARAAGIPNSIQCQGASFDAMINALAQDNLVRILAEPTLTTMSGESASFLAGGEFPIPVGVQNNTISIVFKQYGVSLTFLPTVMSDGRINLHVNPEVSELTTTGAVQMPAGSTSISVPALTVRRANTTVELGSGQSFAIAGLLQKTSSQADSGLPDLGDVPILGSLFRSDAFQRGESELVIVITPYVVRPVNDPSQLALPTDGTEPAGDFDRILRLRQVAQTSPAAPSRIPGHAGFVVQ